MRHIGCEAHGIRLPIITKGDDLPSIVADSTIQAMDSINIKLNENDVIGITESIVAKAQGNFATITDISTDIKEKFPEGVVGVVFPIFSRNRFLNILKGISLGAKKVYVLLQYPHDEVGNPIMDINIIDDVNLSGLIPADDFIEKTGRYKHPFTQVDYISTYQDISPNIEIYFSNDPRDILKLTDKILVAEIHSRNLTKKRLLKAGAKEIYTLSDILNKSINGSGFNSDYGILGSNLSKDDTLKLFPRDCDLFIEKVAEAFKIKTGVAPQVLVYGDGAFKDPSAGIWELADPVVSPAYSEKLGGTPNEIKLKFVADNKFESLSGKEKEEAIANIIKEKNKKNIYNEGTTPRKYADLLGSLCDLMSGSGDKGTPVVLIRGYFDDYSNK